MTGPVRSLIAGDGCTSAPELWFHACCTEHDRAYATHTDATGQPISRAAADRAFLACMQRQAPAGLLSRLLLPRLYWAAVRIFGRRHWRKSTETPFETNEKPKGT